MRVVLAAFAIAGTVLGASAAQAEIKVIYPPYSYQPEKLHCPTSWESTDPDCFWRYNYGRTTVVVVGNDHGRWGRPYSAAVNVKINRKTGVIVGN